VRSYLEIEKVRFGDRLRVEDPSTPTPARVRRSRPPPPAARRERRQARRGAADRRGGRDAHRRAAQRAWSASSSSTPFDPEAEVTPGRRRRPRERPEASRRALGATARPSRRRRERGSSDRADDPGRRRGLSRLSPGGSLRRHFPPGVRAGVLSALVVDDEPLARELLRRALLGRLPDVTVGGRVRRNGFEAVKADHREGPRRSVFLDVQMPKLDGFEVLSLPPRGAKTGAPRSSS